MRTYNSLKSPKVPFKVFVFILLEFVFSARNTSPKKKVFELFSHSSALIFSTNLAEPKVYGSDPNIFVWSVPRLPMHEPGVSLYIPVKFAKLMLNNDGLHTSSKHKSCIQHTSNPIFIHPCCIASHICMEVTHVGVAHECMSWMSSSHFMNEWFPWHTHIMHVMHAN